MNKEQRKQIQKSYTDKMVNYLPVLRAFSQITQNQLAKKLGATRSTTVAIESRKRLLQWQNDGFFVNVQTFYEKSLNRLINEQVSNIESACIF